MYSSLPTVYICKNVAPNGRYEVNPLSSSDQLMLSLIFDKSWFRWDWELFQNYAYKIWVGLDPIWFHLHPRTHQCIHIFYGLVHISRSSHMQWNCVVRKVDMVVQVPCWNWCNEKMQVSLVIWWNKHLKQDSFNTWLQTQESTNSPKETTNLD